MVPKTTEDWIKRLSIADHLDIGVSEITTLYNALNAAQFRATAAEERERALRAVVEWYAQPYLPYRTRLDAWGCFTADVLEDGGDRARAALAALDGSEGAG